MIVRERCLSQIRPFYENPGGLLAAPTAEPLIRRNLQPTLLKR